MVITNEHIWALLEQVPDPEVPVLSVVDLGVVRDVAVTGPDAVTITITPTYSGCPAMDMISMNIRMALLEAGIKDIRIESRLSPAWTTDWMSDEGKRKLKEYGIAPPVNPSGPDGLFQSREQVPCPHCNSTHTELISQFGSTSCKALYRCLDCKEPFDYFKCHR
ncbi:1,2-phenylacetyl-CoA epoxidase subunit PaaD [Rurimicrobium arvi]|uniref:Phenylacetate-CoA oxygenase subunit PaaJ n=1 Tax=Rurimicrobium arvi TaxID=2049916 RepID=A0ABP8N2V3_9BACT